MPKLGDLDNVYSDLLLTHHGTGFTRQPSYTREFVADPAARPGSARARPSGNVRAATDLEWRTPPLWGLRDSAPYLHDGRATSVEEAILVHGGEGSASRLTLSATDAPRPGPTPVLPVVVTAPKP